MAKLTETINTEDLTPQYLKKMSLKNLLTLSGVIRFKRAQSVGISHDGYRGIREEIFDEDGITIEKLMEKLSKYTSSDYRRIRVYSSSSEYSEYSEVYVSGQVKVPENSASEQELTEAAELVSEEIKKKQEKAETRREKALLKKLKAKYE